MHIDDMTMLEAGEWSGDDAPGTVYFDSDPGAGDGTEGDSGGTIGERLGW